MERAVETVQLFGSLLITLLALFIPITIGIVLLRRWLGADRLQRWLGGRRRSTALVKGTALGAVTPFCGCSTVPLLVGLLQAQVSFAAVAAFVLASPLLNPYLLGVVALLFGVHTAVVYAGFAVGTSVLLALLWDVLRLDRHIKLAGYASGRASNQPARQVLGAATASATAVSTAVPAGVSPGTCEGGGCAADPPVEPGGEGGRIEPGGEGGRVEPSVRGDDGDPSAAPWRGIGVELRGARSEAVALLRPMLRPLVLGVTVGALIYGVVPEGVMAALLGESTWYSIPLAAALGLPLYVRGSAAFPIGAALLASGVGQGPMFAMVIAGMAASLPEVTLLSGIFARRLLAVFLASVFAMAIVGAIVIPALT